MSLRGKQVGLIYGLALLIVGCEESGEIGINLDSERGRFVAKYVEIPLRSATYQVDTVLTWNRERVLFGKYSDPDFGTVRSQAFSRLYLSEVLAPDTTAVCDSVVMHLQLDYLYGLQEDGAQALYLHQLADTLETKPYFSVDSVSYLPDPLAMAEFSLTVFDTVRIDTTVQFYLPDTLGQWFLEGVARDTAVGTDQNAFHRYFPGFAFLPGSMNNKVIGIDLFNANSKITMHYHTSEDTLEYRFWFVSQLEEANYFFNTIPNRSGTPLEGLVEYQQEYDPGDGRYYVQSSTGVLTRVSLGPVLDFFDSIGNSVINSAEIQMGTNAYTPLLQPPPALELFILDEDNYFISLGGRFKAVLDESRQRRQNLILPFVPDNESGRGGYSGFMSLYIQELINGVHQDTVFALKPTSLNGSVDRFTGPEDEIVIKMHYSEIK
jgi:hypothetical protein